MSCSSGDMEEAVHSPWLQTVPGKKQLSGQHSVLPQEQHPHCTVSCEQAGGHGVPRESQGLQSVPCMAEMEKVGGVWEQQTSFLA